MKVSEKKLTGINSSMERSLQHQCFIKSPLYWCVTQRRLAVCWPTFRDNLSIPSSVVK